MSTLMHPVEASTVPGAKRRTARNLALERGGRDPLWQAAASRRDVAGEWARNFGQAGAGTLVAAASNVPVSSAFVRGSLALTACIALHALSGCRGSAAQSDTHHSSAKSAKLEPAALPVRSPWASPESCAHALKSKRPRAPGRARIGTWNLHWFPDGQQEAKPKEGGKDVAWFACAIASLDVDVLVVQEVKTHPRGRDAIRELTRRLDRHTGGKWRLETMSCGTPEFPHVGFLFDSARVQAADFNDVPALNPQPTCTADVGNGLSGYFAFPGGLDLHILGVHFLAGDERGGLDGRLVSYAALPKVIRDLQRSNGDSDIVVTGDFNTSGCTDCEPEVANADEVRLLTKALDQPGVSLSLIPATLPCTFNSGDSRQFIDHFAVNLGSFEKLENARASVYGSCLDTRCEDHADEMVVERLSDHCPVVINLIDRDDD